MEALQPVVLLHFIIISLAVKTLHLSKNDLFCRRCGGGGGGDKPTTPVLVKNEYFILECRWVSEAGEVIVQAVEGKEPFLRYMVPWERPVCIRTQVKMWDSAGFLCHSWDQWKNNEKIFPIFFAHKQSWKKS